MNSDADLLYIKNNCMRERERERERERWMDDAVGGGGGGGGKWGERENEKSYDSVTY